MKKTLTAFAFYRSLLWLSFLLACQGAMAQFSQPGELDTTFNPGMPHSYFIGNPLPGSGASGPVYSLALQADGKVLIGGNFTTYNGTGRNRIARLNADGSLDTAFNPGSGADNEVLALALQADGKVLIGGNFTTYNGTARNRIARLNADGSLDTTFNPGSGANGLFVRSLALQADGKVLIGGNFTTYNGTARNCIARLNADGSLDTAFNPGTGADNTVYSLALQADGKVLIGGNFTTYNGIPSNYIARLNADGSLDTTFNPGTGANDFVQSFALQTDGKVLIGGGFGFYNGAVRNRIARLNADGSLDTTFNPGTGANSGVLSLALQTDGKVLIGGEFTTYNGTARNYIARVNADGSLDPTFNPGSGANNPVRSFALQADGKVLIGGNFTTYNGTARNRITRLNADGSLDPTFNPVSGANSQVNSLALQADGKVLIGGSFTTYNSIPRNRIARLNADGSLDTTFNPGTGADDIVYSLALQTDGKVLIGGDFTTYNGTARNRIARLNADGSLDTAFNPGTGANDFVQSFALQTDGKVLIGGSFTTYNSIARLNADGSLDAGFNPGTGANSSVNSLALQADGKVLIGGSFTTYNSIPRNRIARLNADGSLDTTFNPGTGADDIVYSLALQDDGKVLIGGWFTSYNGTGRNYIARLNADGSLDPTFNPGSGANSFVHSLALQADGKVLIGGSFTTYNSIPRNRIARLNADGSLDAGFNPGTGANSSVNSLALQGDGKVLIGGDFTTYNGTTRSRIARLLGVCVVANSTDSSSICGGGTKTLSGTAGGTWSIVSGAGNIAGNIYTHSGPATPVTVRNQVGACFSDVSFTINPLPGTPVVINQSTCTGTTAVITPSSGGASYRFYVDSTGGSPLPGGNGVSAFTTPVLSNTTTWYVSSVSPEGCESGARTPVTVTVNPLPPEPVATDFFQCGPGPFSVVPSGGSGQFNVYGSQSGGVPVNGGNGVTIFNTPVLGSSTTYYIASISPQGCESPSRVPVNLVVNPIPGQPSPPTISICAGTPATLQPTGGGGLYNFYTAPVGGLPIPGAALVPSHTTPPLTGFSVYYLAAANQQGCESSPRIPVVVSVNTFNLGVNAANATCGSNNGSATVNITGGTPPFNILWTSGSQSNTANNLPPGNYTVTVTDGAGCVRSATATVQGTNAPGITLVSQTNASCFNAATGAVDISVSGGLPPYTYLWSNGTSTQDATGLAAGVYDITVTDANGCPATQSYTVTGPPVFTAAAQTTPTDCGAATSTAKTVANGGAPPYAYLWNTTATSDSIGGLAAGFYQATVTDSNGCTVAVNAAVGSNGAPVITLDSIVPASCGQHNGAVYLTVSGGATPYAYAWSNGDTVQDLVNVKDSVYNLTVTGGNNCASGLSATVPVKQPDMPLICLVTVDSATRTNEVVWEKPLTNPGVAFYRVYRESSATNVYIPVGAVHADSLSAFVDTVASPFQKSWKYRISAVDSCGTESALSPPHKTVHLLQSVSVVPGNINLLWDNYQGLTLTDSTYYIYRNTSASFTLIDSIAISPLFNSYIDTPPNVNDTLLFYVVEALPPNTCTATEAKNFNTTRSNPSRVAASGIEILGLVKLTGDGFEVKAYPVPFGNGLTIETPGGYDYEMLDMTGRTVLKGRSVQDITLLDTRGLPQGAYVLRIIRNEGVVTRKLVKEE